MRVLSVIVAHPLRKISGATNAGLQLSEATAGLVDLEAAVMWDAEAIESSGELLTRYVRCTNRLGPLARLVPRMVRVPLYDSRIPRIIRTGGYDLVHIHNLVPTLAAERICKMCLRRGIPYVISTHGFFELSRYAEINNFGAIKSRLVDFVLTQPFRRIVAGAAGILALSDREYDLLTGMGVSRSKISVVTNGVNEFYLEQPSAAELVSTRSSFGIRSDVPVLLFMGSLHPYKGVGNFLSALKHIRGPFQAVVAGKFDNRTEVDELLAKADLPTSISNAVLFTGGVSNEQLRALYHSATVFVYPTMGDTLPLVVLEAMASGLPVVSTTIGGIPFAVTPDCGVLVPPGNVAAVADAVNNYLESPGLGTSAGARGRARVRSTFRWANSAQRALAAYSKVLTPAAGRRAETESGTKKGKVNAA